MRCCVWPLALAMLLLLAAGAGSAQQEPPEGAKVTRTVDDLLGIRLVRIEWLDRGQTPGQTDATMPPQIEIGNAFGDIRIVVEATKELEIRAVSGDRTVSSGDVAVEETAGALRVVSQPNDGAEIDLEVVVPYGLLVRAVTTSGGIKYEAQNQSSRHQPPSVTG